MASHLEQVLSCRSRSVHHLLLYGLSTSVAMAANFFLVLVLVRVLEPQDYAKFVLVKVSLLLISSLAGMGLSQAAVRWSGLSDRPDRVLSSVILGALLMAGPAFVVLVSWFYFNADVVGVQGGPLFYCFLALSICLYLVNAELLNWPRAIHKPSRQTVFNATRGLLQFFCIAAIAYHYRRVEAFIYGMAIAEALFLGFVALTRPTLGKPSVVMLKNMLKYGWPHTLVIASGFLLTYADRYMLALLGSDARVVAYYDAGYMVVSSALALLTRPFNLYLFPAYTKSMYEHGEVTTIALIEKAQKGFLIAASMFGTVIVLGKEHLLSWLFPAGYEVAQEIFEPIALSMILNGIFMATVAGLYISDRTIMVGFSSIIALIANIAMNSVLIPKFGMNGAAYSTALSSIIWVSFGYIFGRKKLAVRFPLVEISLLFCWFSLLSYVT